MYAADPATLPRLPLYRAALAGWLRCRRVDRLVGEAIDDWQRRRFAQLHAGDRSGDFCAHPILERETLRRRAEQVTPQRDTVLVQTSGSTGSPLRLALALDEYATGLAGIAFGFQASGVRLGDRIAHLCVPAIGERAPVHERIGLWRTRRIDLRRDAREVFNALIAWRPDVLYAYPSHLETLLPAGPVEAREPVAALASGLPAIRLVICNGEPLDEPLRSRLGTLLGAQVVDSYGAVELPRIAFACRFGRLHELSALVHVETDPATRDDGGAGDLLLTSLYHRRLPLVRYRIGDRGRIESGVRCRCGRSGRVIERIEGRCDELLLLPGGRRVSPRAVSLLEHDERVREFQLVQVAVDRLELHVVTRAPLAAVDRDRLLRLVKSGLGDPLMSVVWIDRESLPRTGTGKRRAVLRRLD